MTSLSQTEPLTLVLCVAFSEMAELALPMASSPSLCSMGLWDHGGFPRMGSCSGKDQQRAFKTQSFPNGWASIAPNKIN